MGKKSILIVEDDPDIIHLITRSLDEQIFKILQAESGTQALDMLEKTHPDLILLDIMMPDIDGFQVCQKIKQNPETKAIPVVILSVRNNDEDFERGKQVGADGYFTKPFDPFKLGEDIKKILS
jgi:CheY-like chemotaxis protein